VDDASVRVDGIEKGRHVGWEHLDQKAHSRGLPADADDDYERFSFPRGRSCPPIQCAVVVRVKAFVQICS
jgi:hypothetical protein